MTPPGGPWARPRAARGRRPAAPAQRPTSTPSSSSTHHRHVGVVEAGLDRLRRLLHEPVRARGSRAIRCATEARRAIWSARCWLCGSRPPQRLVGPPEPRAPAPRARAACSCASMQPSGRLLLLGLEQDLEPPVPQLVQGEQALGQGLAVGAAREQEGQAAAVEDADGAGATGCKLSPGARGRATATRASSARSSSSFAARRAARAAVQGRRCRRHGGPARRLGADLHQRRASRTRGARRGAAPGCRPSAAGSARGASLAALSPRCRQAMPPVSGVQRHAAKPRARPSAPPKAAGVGKRATDAGR